MSQASQQDVKDASDGLLKTIEKLEKDFGNSMVQYAATALVADASTLLGLDFQAKQYESRRSALLEPDVYAGNRGRAFNAMKTAINDKHAEAIKHYLGAGMPPEMAKKVALQAAANESAIQQQVFELSFPSGANVLELNTQVANENSKIPGFGAAQPRRRAPARRRRR